MGGIGEQVVAGREFSREVEVERIPIGGRPFEIAAEPAERAALARRLGLEALDRLAVEGTLGRDRSGRTITLEGRLRAEVTQLCVATLEPVESRLEVPLRRLFATGPEPATGEVVVDPLLDEPEPLPGGRLDLGAIAAEELVLALDPYPRAAGGGCAGRVPAERDGRPGEPP